MATLPSPQQVAAGLRLHVVGQNDAQLTLSVAIVNHYRRLLYKAAGGNAIDEFNKNNVLILGPTGSGKTHMIRTLARMMDLPFASGDATKITQAGYVGGNVEDLLLELWQQAGRDLAKAQRGIVFIDEVDKIRANYGTGPDVNGEGVQRALLTLFNGSVVEFSTPNGKVKFDTKNVLFICAGAFVGLEQIIQDRVTPKGSIGFSGQIRDREQDPIKKLELMLQVSAADLVNYGFIPEFVGRLPVRTAVMPLSEDELCRILTEPKNSLVKQAQALLPDGMHIEFSEKGCRAIAKEAQAFGTGARALQEIVEEVVRPIIFTTSSGTVEVTEEMVLKRKDILRASANAPLSAGTEPCSFSFEELSQEAALQPQSTSTALVPVTTARPELTLREIERRGNDTHYTRLLEDPKTRMRVFHVHCHDITGTCSCGYKTPNISYDRMVTCGEKQDPIEFIHTKGASWTCEGCGKTCTDEKYKLSESNWLTKK